MGTKYRGSARQRRALNAYITLLRASESVSAPLFRDLHAVELAPSQFGVLDALLHLGPMRQRDLARKILRSPGNLTMVIDNLERRKLVRRQRSEEDRRTIFVHLTETGNKLIERVMPEHVAAITDRMAALTKSEQEGLIGLCKKLGKAAETRRTR